MRTAHAVSALVMLVVACSSGGPGSTGSPPPSRVPSDAGSASAHDGAIEDGGWRETGGPPADAGDVDARAGDACSVSGAPGQCLDVSACAKLDDHTSFSGYCPGPADIECCVVTPSTADNPPTPAGYVLMAQSQVTPEMTTWAVSILDDSTSYPMFATVTKTFGTLMVLARVEWHPPDFNNSAVHRGVTLYEPI
jgi:hypothetical protein